MLKKAVLLVLAAMLIAFSASATFALQVDGLQSGIGSLGTGTSGYTQGEIPYPDGLIPSVNPGGLGNALIYGYYNVRGNLNLFNIVNTSTVDGAKVRVVFRNAKNSQEILDFSVCLSKGDMWTAFLSDDGIAGHIYGGIDTDTITAPTITASGQEFKFGSGGLANITGDDTREGYFEVIGLSPIPNYDKNASTNAACTSSSGPQNCIRSANDCANWGNNSSAVVDLGPVGNVLFGNNSIIAFSDLATYSYNATAIADAFLIPNVDPGPGSELSIPTLMDPPSLFGDAEGIPESGCVAFDWILMKDKVIAPYDLLASIAGETDVVLTFPSRLRCHGTDDAYFDNDGDINELGGDMFDCFTYDNSGTCTEYRTKVGIDIWDDQEHRLSLLDFSPATGSTLSHEVNVLHIGGSNIWNSTVALSLSVGDFQLGWVSIDLASASDTHFINWSDDFSPSPGSNGLPVIAYTTQSIAGGASSYMVPAQYTTDINNGVQD
jgi:hypothetical protein